MVCTPQRVLLTATIAILQSLSQELDPKLLTSGHLYEVKAMTTTIANSEGAIEIKCHHRTFPMIIAALQKLEIDFREISEHCLRAEWSHLGASVTVLINGQHN